MKLETEVVIANSESLQAMSRLVNTWPEERRQEFSALVAGYQLLAESHALNEMAMMFAATFAATERDLLRAIREKGH